MKLTDDIEVFNRLEASIYKQCQYYGISCKFAENIIYLRTPVARWKIEYEDSYVRTLLHENYRPNRNFTHRQRRKPGEGYHIHKIDNHEIHNVIRYIHFHDKKHLNEILREK